MTERRRGSWAGWFFHRGPLCVPALVAGGVALGYAIHIRDGEYIGHALLCVAIACVCAVLATIPTRLTLWLRTCQATLIALTLAYLIQFIAMLRAPASGWNEWSDDLKGVPLAAMWPYYTGVLIAGLLAGASLLAGPRLRRVCVPLLLATHVAVGVWMIRHAPQPFIDVYHFQQEASAALKEGKNPYAVAMPDIYAGTEKEKDRTVYGQGLSHAGKLSFGFPYTPLSLLLAFAGWLAAGDHRYAQLAAMTLAGGLVSYTRMDGIRGSPARIAAAAGALLLFTPRAFFILGRGWTEPFVVCSLAATIFAAVRRPSPSTTLPGSTKGGGRAPVALPILLGLFLATKQYLIFVAPAVYLLTPAPPTWRRFATFFLQSVAVAALVTAPLALWDVNAFFHSIGTVQKIAPFRDDALSFLVWIHHLTGVKLGVGLAFAATAVASAFAVCRCPRSPAGFAAAITLIYLPLIALNKQAFANYYYFVIGAFWCAVAAAEPTRNSVAAVD